MNRTTLLRLNRLESAAPDRTRRLLVAGNKDEAANLRRRHPEAVVIVTGVRREAHMIALRTPLVGDL